MLKKHFVLLSMLKIIVLLDIFFFLEIVIHFFFDEQKVLKNSLEKNRFCNKAKVFTAILDQINASFLNIVFLSFRKLTPNFEQQTIKKISKLLFY